MTQLVQDCKLLPDYKQATPYQLSRQVNTVELWLYKSQQNVEQMYLLSAVNKYMCNQQQAWAVGVTEIKANQEGTGTVGSYRSMRQTPQRASVHQPVMIRASFTAGQV